MTNRLEDTSQGISSLENDFAVAHWFVCETGEGMELERRVSLRVVYTPEQ